MKTKSPREGALSPFALLALKVSNFLLESLNLLLVGLGVFRHPLGFRLVEPHLVFGGGVGFGMADFYAGCVRHGKSDYGVVGPKSKFFL